MCCETWDGDYTLGPFYDEDGSGILPCTTEATDELLAECMGYYQVRATIPNLDGQHLLLCNRLLTHYIQENWDDVMGGGASAGFLLAYRSPHKAVGRLAEDVLCREVVRLLLPGHAEKARVLTVQEACKEGLMVKPVQGCRSDDLFVQRPGGARWLVESKASFTGHSYLRRCLPKALAQLRAMGRLNPSVERAFLVLSALRQKAIAVVGLPTVQLTSLCTADALAGAGRLIG
jgi:hypothetical protein